MKKTEEMINQIKSDRENETIQVPNGYFVAQGNIYDVIKQELEAQQLKPADLIKGVGLDLQNGYKYINGTNKISRDLALKILIFFKKSFDEIQDVLKLNQYPVLYPKIKRDYFIINGIIRGENIDEINNILSMNSEIQL